MFKIVIVDDDRQMQAIIRDKIKEKTDAFRDAKIQIFSSAEAFLAEAKQEEHGEEGDLFFVDIELGGHNRTGVRTNPPEEISEPWTSIPYIS